MFPDLGGPDWYTRAKGWSEQGLSVLVGSELEKRFGPLREWQNRDAAEVELAYSLALHTLVTVGPDSALEHFVYRMAPQRRHLFVCAPDEWTPCGPDRVAVLKTKTPQIDKEIRPLIAAAEAAERERREALEAARRDADEREEAARLEAEAARQELAAPEAMKEARRELVEATRAARLEAEAARQELAAAEAMKEARRELLEATRTSAFGTSGTHIVSGHEWMRRCHRCEATWYVPAEIALEPPPNEVDLFGTRMEAVGRDLTIFGSGAKRTAAHTKLARLEAAKQRYVENARCPSCRSIEFSQTPA
jgi:hypothetical protein